MNKDNNNYQEANKPNKNPSSLADDDGSVEIIGVSKFRSDSAYCSLVSQKGVLMRNMSPVTYFKGDSGGVIWNKTESEGTSYSSRGSGLINDEEMEGMFLSGGTFLAENSRGREDLTTFESWNLRHTMRTSPWTVRPESTPLHEEDEDDDNKVSHYSCSPPQDLPELVQCTLQNIKNKRHPFCSSDQRNEHIAIKLREIADNLNLGNKRRSRNLSMSSEAGRPSQRRNSFADIVPCGCESIVDLILSLYNVYKVHSQNFKSPTVVTSPSMACINTTHPRVNSRSRSFTQ